MRDEVIILLTSIRAGSGRPLLGICAELGPLLGVKPSNLRQQWLRWTAGAPRLAGGVQAETTTKPAQVPALEILGRIYRESVNRNWLPESVPGAEALCELLIEEFGRQKTELLGRVGQKRCNEIQEFVGGMVDDYLQEEGARIPLWRVLPQGVGEVLGEALVRCLEERLVFDSTSAEDCGKGADLRAYNAFQGKDAYTMSARMCSEIGEDFGAVLGAYAERLVEAKAAQNRYEVEVKDEMLSQENEDVEQGGKGWKPRYRT